MSHLPWAIAYTNPGAEVPQLGVPYQPGALYEIVLGLAIFAVLWRLRHRLRPTMPVWWFVGLYSAGRFVMFFYRSDSPVSALGLRTEQWVSIGLLALAVAGGWWSDRRGWARPPGEQAQAKPTATSSPVRRRRAPGYEGSGVGLAGLGWLALAVRTALSQRPALAYVPDAYVVFAAVIVICVGLLRTVRVSAGPHGIAVVRPNAIGSRQEACR